MSLDAIDKERDEARMESMSKLDLDTSEGLFRALCILGKIKLRPERPRLEELQLDYKCRGSYGTCIEDRYLFANPVPQPFRKVRIGDLSYTNIEWQMLTLHRSKVPGDELIFTRYVDLARQRVKTIGCEIIEKNYRSADSFFRSWRLNERWSPYEDDSSDEEENADDLTYKPDPNKVPFVPYDHDAFVRQTTKNQSSSKSLCLDSININRIVQRLEKLRTMNPFHYKPPKEPKPKVRKNVVRRKIVNLEGKVVVELERCSSFEEDLASVTSLDLEAGPIESAELSSKLNRKRIVQKEKMVLRANRKKRRHLWCVACAAAQKPAMNTQNKPLNKE